MPLRTIADKALDDINATLGGDLSEEQQQEITKIVEKALDRSAKSIASAHREVTVVCCGPEADLAHKIQEEADRAVVALTATLMSFR